MKIYNVEYTTEQKVERRMIDDEGLDVEFKIDKEDKFETVTLYLQIGGDNFYSATFEATELLDEVYGEHEYEILGVQEIQGVDIMNWPGENSNNECQCVGCRTERAAEEDKLRFVHNCGEEISVVADGWETINCPKCHEEIYRDKIIGSNGHYIYININGESKEEKKG